MQLQIIHRRILKKLPSCFSRPQMAPKAPSQEAAAWTVAMCLKDTETKQFFKALAETGTRVCDWFMIACDSFSDYLPPSPIHRAHHLFSTPHMHSLII